MANIPTYAERVRIARSRLHAALDPADQAEQSVVDWLAGTLPTPGSLDTLVSLVERARGESGAS